MIWNAVGLDQIASSLAASMWTRRLQYSSTEKTLNTITYVHEIKREKASYWNAANYYSLDKYCFNWTGNTLPMGPLTAFQVRLYHRDPRHGRHDRHDSKTDVKIVDRRKVEKNRTCNLCLHDVLWLIPIYESRCLFTIFHANSIFDTSLPLLSCQFHAAF